MKSITLLVVALVVLGLYACDSNKTKVKSPQYDLSYAYGSTLASQLANAPLSANEKNADKFAEGFMKGLEGDSATNMEAQKALQERFNRKEQADTTDKEAAYKIAYYIGISAIGGLAQEVDVNPKDFNKEAFAEGFRDVVNKDSLELEVGVRDSIFRSYTTSKNKEYEAKMKAKAEAESSVNITAGEAFLETNKNKEGVITTESGLQYEIIKEGTGKQPALTDQVVTHYHGTLLDGSVFDSSVDRGQPATFGVNQVIPGWQEGIPLMKEGAKYRFYIPQELAYGMRSPSASIPAGAMLIFDVELLEVKAGAVPVAPTK